MREPGVGTLRDWSATLRRVIPDQSETVEAWRSGRLGELVTRVLQPLVGEPFMDFGRAADMMWLGFGEETPAPTKRDPERRAALHRLNVSCPLRLDSANGVLVASSDIYRQPRGTTWSEDFHWDAQGANLFDRSVAAYWEEHQPGSAVVDRVDADAFGGLQLQLSNGHIIRIFPSSSEAYEHWRYFEINGDRHFVVIPEHPD
jgi:hypothetical protein